MGSPARTDVFAAVEATESRRDIVAFEILGIAMFRDSDFCSVPFLEALRSSARRGRCADVVDGVLEIAGADTPGGLFVLVPLGTTGADVVATTVTGRSPPVGTGEARDVVCS